MMNIKGIIWVMVIVAGIAACSDPVAEDVAKNEQSKQDSLNQASLDADAFDQFIARDALDNFEITVTESGLRYLVLDEGLGEQYMDVNDIVSVDFTAEYYTEGKWKVFDTSVRQVAIDNEILSANIAYDPLVFNYIPIKDNLKSRFENGYGGGFGEGLDLLMPKLSVGGSGRVMIPSAIITRSVGFSLPLNTAVVFKFTLSQLRP